MSQHPAEVLLSRFESVRGKHPKWIARCPAHEDRSPSLSVKALDDGRVLVHCFAGCGAADVMAAVGLTLAALYPKGACGEFFHAPQRRAENTLTRTGYQHMQDEIYRLRARVK
jgi:hypothetical protein